MDEETTEDATTAPVYKKGEKVWYVPQNGQQREKVIIEDLPTSSRSKYLLKFSDGNVMPVNGCYIAKV